MINENMDIIPHLPLDLRKKIVAYTYQVQSEDLLNDIHNYHETKIVLKECIAKLVYSLLSKYGCLCEKCQQDKTNAHLDFYKKYWGRNTPAERNMIIGAFLG